MSRQHILATAQTQEGTKEHPAGSNMQTYGAWYGLNGVKWCAIFVSWVYDHAGHPLGKIETPKGYHYCQGGYNFFKSAGQVTKNPQPGDIVLYDWSGDGHCDHTGIFEEWTDNAQTSFFAWEGNTEVGNDSDGGIVMRRVRKASLVRAFVSPAVLGDATTKPDDTVQKGDRGAKVTYIQKMLWSLSYTIDVDGIFGEETETVLKQFQKEHFLEETGIIDPAVMGAMEEEIGRNKQVAEKTSTASYLQKGNSGAPVKALQRALNDAGANPKLTADGVFGNDTLIAVKKFQQGQNLKADGVAGPKTFAALKLEL